MAKDTHASLRVVAEEAATWFLLFEDGDQVSEQERGQFVGWLQRSPAHIEEFMRVSAMHEVFSASPIAAKAEIDALIAEARSNVVTLDSTPALSETPKARRPLSYKSFAWYGSAVAASLFLVVATLALWSGSDQPVLYETAFGEQRSVLLEDGSIITLNTETQVEIAYSDRERLIKLAGGEAVFNVAKDKTRPFRVLAGATEAIAVGTKFNVYRGLDKTTVTVVEGKVAINSLPDTSHVAPVATDFADTASLLLEGGSQIVVQETGLIEAKKAVDPIARTAWTERRLVLSGDTLATAVSEINRYNQKKLEINDPLLADKRISGVFSVNNPEAMIAFLREIGEIEVAENTQGWVLSSRAQGQAGLPKIEEM